MSFVCLFTVFLFAISQQVENKSDFNYYVPGCEDPCWGHFNGDNIKDQKAQQNPDESEVFSNICYFISLLVAWFLAVTIDIKVNADYCDENYAETYADDVPGEQV